MVDLSHSCLICIIFFKSCNETVVYIGILWCVLYDCSLHTPLGIMGNHMHRSKSAWRSSSFNGFLSVYLVFLQETSIPLYVAVFYTIENSVLWSFYSLYSSYQAGSYDLVTVLAPHFASGGSSVTFTGWSSGVCRGDTFTRMNSYRLYRKSSTYPFLSPGSRMDCS